MISFSPFTINQSCFMTSNMAYPGENVPCALDKNVYSALAGWSALYMPLGLVGLWWCSRFCFLVDLLSSVLSLFCFFFVCIMRLVGS